MKNLKTVIKSFDWSELNDKHFVIPIYQRRYAWEKEQVEQLLKDIKDSTEEYYVGNLVLEEREDGKLEVIDGQQRLTTLYLLSKILKINHFELHYEVRENDENFLKEFNGEKDVAELLKKHKADPIFKENIEAIHSFLENNEEKIKERIKDITFSATFLHADEVDVAKYFEVMNSRGKQLEQHQVIKALMLKDMDNDERGLYAAVWDYCSNMNQFIGTLITRYGTKDKKSQEVMEELWQFLNGKKI